MAPFSLLSSYGVMGVHVSGSTQSKTLYIGDNFRIHVGTAQPLVRHRGFGSLDSIWHDSSVFVHLVGCINCCKSQFGVSCDDERIIRSQIQKKNGDKQPPVSKNINLKKQFSLRFRARLRLLSMRLKRVSMQAMSEEFGVFVRRNSKRVTISTFISVVLGLCYLFLKLTAVPSPEAVPYSDLIMNLQNGSVSKVLFEEGSRRIFYNTVSKSPDNPQLLKKELPIGDVQLENSGDTDLSVNGKRSLSLKPIDMLRRLSRKQVTTPEWQFSTRRIEYDEKFLLSLMRGKGTAYSSAPQSVIMSMRNILVTILSLWIPLTPFMWLLYRQFSAANSPAKKRRPSNQTVSFNDVEGVDTAKAELTEVVLCLQGAINYTKLGAKLPRGVLLVGPPGTGKTLLARAVAGEAGVPFFSVSASEFVELFVGRGAARIRDLFAVARKYAPSIIFIDELDAVGGKRGRSFNDERDQTLNQLLTELDGFDTDMKVVVIGATNRPEALDPALCRPGRFSRKVFVGQPDEEGRRKILAVHLRGVPLEEGPQIICSLIASLTQGFVGADLANIINEAALLAARRGSESVTREDIMESIERAKFGINDRRLNTRTISKELGKLFPWMPSLMKKNGPRENDSEGPLGYQALS